MPRTLRLAGAAALSLAALLLPLGFHSLAQNIPPGAGDAVEGQGPPMGWNLRNLNPEQQQRMLRFSTFVNQGIPGKYLKAENSVGYTTRAIAEGGPLYATHCQKCHGDTGLGNGDLAYALTPSPALLAYMVQQPIAIDQYLLWSISEGGKPFDTSMPSFEDELSEDQIWQIVAYLRAGFPAVEDDDAPAKRETAPPATTDAPSLKPKSGE